MKDAARRGFRIIVYSRVDEIVDPDLDTPTSCFDPHLQLPHVDLRLYNHTSNSIAGVHYDPMYCIRSSSPSTENNANRQRICENTSVDKSVQAKIHVQKRSKQGQ